MSVAWLILILVVLVVILIYLVFSFRYATKIPSTGPLIKRWMIIKGLSLQLPNKNEPWFLYRHKPFPFPWFYVQYLGRGHFGPREIVMGGSGYYAGSWIIFIQTELSGSFPGRMFVKNSFSTLPMKDELVDLESVEFNRELDVRAKPKQLAFTVLAPDTMEWYLRLRRRPFFFLAERTLVLVLPGIQSQQDLDELPTTMLRLADLIEHSGALDKKI